MTMNIIRKIINLSLGCEFVCKGDPQQPSADKLKLQYKIILNKINIPGNKRKHLSMEAYKYLLNSKYRKL